VALVGVTIGREIGVDVERLREVRHAEHIARRYFHAAEIAAIAAAPASERNTTFLRIWTGKEALLKALGAGITGTLSAFHVPVAEDTAAGVTVDMPTRSPAGCEACWLRWLELDSDYVASVAVVGTRLDLRCMTFLSDK
jgi:4'-phosphopantetheinyl transferase